MKSFVLKADRKFFPAFNFKLSPSSALPFVLECLLMFLFASVDKFGFALALALFCGLAYARQNILLVAPCFIAAVFVFTMDWQYILFALSPTILLAVVYFVFFKLRRNVPVWAVGLSAVVGMTPYIVVGILFSNDYLGIAVSVLVALVGTFCCAISAYAVFVRKVFGKATVDELICSGFVVVAFGYALAKINVYGFYLFPLIFSFLAVIAAACLPSSVTLFLSILLGVGEALCLKNITYLGVAVAIGGAAVAFSPFSRLPSAFAVLTVEGVFWLFSAYAHAGWKSLLCCAVGVCCALIIPRSLVKKAQSIVRNDQKHAYSSIINMRGKDVANRLYLASDVFFGASKALERFSVNNGKYTPTRLAKDVVKNYCAKCENKSACFSSVGDDLYTIIEPMANAALSRGKTTILDMPPFITARCSKMHSLASVINSTADAYREKTRAVSELGASKQLIGEQFAGVSLILDSLASDVGAPVAFVGDDVDVIKSELLRHNVVATDIVVAGRESNVSVTLIVRAGDADKEIIPKLLSKILRTKLKVSGISDRGKDKAVYLETAPIYEVAYGIAERMRSGEDVSGDSRSVLNVSPTKRLFAICDGMGSGEEAHTASLDAIQMIESFYKAGFQNDIVLNLVNRLLKISLDDNYSTLDISVIDTKSGALDIIKLGSASSFIIRRDSVEAVACQSMPAGVLSEVTPTTLRFQLFDGDMVVMMSDGVYDVLDDKGVVDVVDSLRTSNPQTLANELLKRAVENGSEDDCTVLVTRLFCA